MREGAPSRPTEGTQLTAAEAWDYLAGGEARRCWSRLRRVLYRVSGGSVQSRDNSCGSVQSPDNPAAPWKGYDPPQAALPDSLAPYTVAPDAFARNS